MDEWILKWLFLNNHSPGTSFHTHLLIKLSIQANLFKDYYHERTASSATHLFHRICAFIRLDNIENTSIYGCKAFLCHRHHQQQQQHQKHYYHAHYTVQGYYHDLGTYHTVYAFIIHILNIYKSEICTELIVAHIYRIFEKIPKLMIKLKVEKKQ